MTQFINGLITGLGLGVGVIVVVYVTIYLENFFGDGGDTL